MRRNRIAAAPVALALVALGAVASGCGGVKAWQKEQLADPIMSFEADSREAAGELHWIEAREGSTGGTGSAGGGCACN